MKIKVESPSPNWLRFGILDRAATPKYKPHYRCTSSLSNISKLKWDLFIIWTQYQDTEAWPRTLLTIHGRVSDPWQPKIQEQKREKNKWGGGISDNEPIKSHISWWGKERWGYKSLMGLVQIVLVFVWISSNSHVQAHSKSTSWLAHSLKFQDLDGSIHNFKSFHISFIFKDLFPCSIRIRNLVFV